jgi:hypothetical protein
VVQGRVDESTETGEEKERRLTSISGSAINEEETKGRREVAGEG